METKENEIQEYERKNTGNRPDKAVDAKEIDLTDKVRNVIRFGLVGMLAIGLIVSGIVWSMKANSGEVVTNDAKVASVMVGVRSKTAGTITEILVEDGQEVEAGTIVARLKVDVTEEQIKQLENTVELSKANLEQVKKGTVVTVAAPAPAASYQAGGNSAEIAGLQRRLDRMNQLLEMGAVSITERDAAAAALAEARAAAVPVAPSAPAATTRIEPASPEAIKNAELAVKQAEMARRFIINGIKNDLGDMYHRCDTNIKPEDLTFYAEMIEKADSDLQFAKNSLSDWCRGQKNA